MDGTEFTESRGRSFSDYWPVAPDHRVEDGVIRPLVAAKAVTTDTLIGVGQYLPMARPELPGELAKAATGREADVRAFVQRYGLLGFYQAWRFPEEAMGARQMARETGMTTAHRGDPLPWFLAHARTVKMLLDLIGSLASNEAVLVATDQLKVRTEQGFDQFEYVAAYRGRRSPTRHIMRVMEPRAVALTIISEVLNANLQGVSRFLLPEVQEGKEAPLGLSSLFANGNLLDAIYWHLADAAVGGWVRRCANPRCGAFFVAQSAKVKFCPPPMGNVDVSPCMNRHKQQAWRDEEKRKREAAKRKATRIAKKSRRTK